MYEVEEQKSPRRANHQLTQLLCSLLLLDFVPSYRKEHADAAQNRQHKETHFTRIVVRNSVDDRLLKMQADKIRV